MLSMPALENYLSAFVVLLIAGCSAPEWNLQQAGESMKQTVFLKTDKTVYHSGETITVELWNNSGKKIFVMNMDSRYSRFLVVQKQEDGTFDYFNAPYLFDPSKLAQAGVGLPEAIETPTGKTVLGQWNGTAFDYSANGKIQQSKPKGVFKAVLSEGYSFETSLTPNGFAELKNPVKPLESNEFEIK
jgi:hypothetical protein